MRIPIATYRLQFSPDFGFRQARHQLAYLRELGISDLYASPVFRARPGSRHGYDVIDHNQLNSELGTDRDLSRLAEAVRDFGMGWLQDIVPNHMAIDGGNHLLRDVLENGPASPYANCFDIDWTRPYGARRAQLLLPLLGRFFGRVLEDGELHLFFNEQGLGVRYFRLELPLRIESYREILEACLQQMLRDPGEEHADTIQLRGLLYLLATLSSESDRTVRLEQVSLLKKNLWILHGKSAALRQALRQVLEQFNGRTGKPESFSRLEKLLSKQWFRLTFWKVATEEINYRRFFCINELISLRMEHPETFFLAHQLVVRLLADGTLTGLRIDHVDGLHDPRTYLEKIRGLAPDSCVVVEKVLAPGEDLPDWPVQGTTGYDFLNMLNGLFCSRTNEKSMSRIYGQFIRKTMNCAQLEVEKKRLILDRDMAGDLANLVRRLLKLARRYRYGSDFTRHGLSHALTEIMVRMPIYRTYLGPGVLRDADRQVLRQVLRQASSQQPGLVHEIEFIGAVLQQEFEVFLAPAQRREWLHFAMRFQQFTGPLMAKGVEDTLLYVYNRLLSLNEVGGSPERFGLDTGAFHEFCLHRQRAWPHSMNASATHDTKRGEDVRARLNVLTEMPQAWRQVVQEWSRLNRPLKQRVGRCKAPDRNDEYFLYQTLVGAWPAEPDDLAAFGGRLQEYLIKVVREAKVHTAWIKPEQDYEEAFTAFAAALLDPRHGFLERFLPFQRTIAFFGMCNSLAQTLVKITAPGFPDFYQGSELWDLNLVDPDNRRPVDFGRRSQTLQQLKKAFRQEPHQLLKDLLDHWQDGRIKLFLIYRALEVRNHVCNLCQEGDYLPLDAEGPAGGHLLAFARHRQGDWLVTLVPRFAVGLVETERPPLGNEIWGETGLQLPVEAEWTEMITGRSLGRRDQLKIGEVLADFPVALLAGHG